MNNELYKDDDYFMELLSSGDRARQCDYRNAIIKELKRRKKANKDDGKTSWVFLLNVLRYTSLMLLSGCFATFGWLVLLKYYGATTDDSAAKISELFFCTLMLCILSMLTFNMISSIIGTKDANDTTSVENQYDELTEHISKDSRSILMAKKEVLDEVIWNPGKP